jgi:hypothetical protein
MESMAPASKRGNPNWGKSIPLCEASPTAFETEGRRLRLTRDMYIHSATLRRWYEQNRNRFYIPEWLPEVWGITVDTTYYAA